jgi:hypothetical protein
MRYLLLVVLLFSFSFCSGCKRPEFEPPKLMRGGDSEPLEEDTSRPSDFNERMRRICPF